MLVTQYLSFICNLRMKYDIRNLSYSSRVIKLAFHSPLPLTDFPKEPER
jgi:hypothetical protein